MSPVLQAYGKSVAAPNQDDWEGDLADKLIGYIAQSAQGKSMRDRDSRIGAYLFYGQHWRAPWPAERAAITANLSFSLIHHIISIMTKQEPIPVVEAADAGDNQAADLMRRIIMRVWKHDDMQLKLRKVLQLCKTTYTSAWKVIWDRTARGGAGDICTDVVPGWYTILDSRVNDYGQMSYAGDICDMSRQRAMLQYPESAGRIKDAQEANRLAKVSSPSGTPVKNPWGSGPLPISGATSINGKPTITAFAGELGLGSEPHDTISIAEVYHKDFSLTKTQEPVRNHLGEIEQEVIRDEDGFPQFEPLADQEVGIEGGGTVGIPHFRLITAPKYEDRLTRVYPHWRRTTMLIQDQIILDDIAWDGPLPYAFFNDVEPLDGLWSRGSILQLETLQTQLNVSLSSMTDNLRMGACQPILSGPRAALETQVLYPGAGQVIPVGDINDVKPLEFPQLSEAWFSYIGNLGQLMENIIGAKGVMQGEAQGRLDSAAGYDLLAEIGGSRIVESTQRMEGSLAKWAHIVSWFAQRYYTEKHAIKVEKSDGQITWERAWGPLLMGTLDIEIETGSTLAWSESAREKRNRELLQAGIIDKIEYYKRSGFSNWRQMVQRMQTEPPMLQGQAGAPPPRTRQRVSNKGKQQPAQ